MTDGWTTSTRSTFVTEKGPHRLEDGSGCRQVDGVAAVQPRGCLYGNQVIVLTTDGRVIAMDKDTGKVLWDKNYQVANTDVFTSAPLIVKDMIIVPGRAPISEGGVG